MFGSITRVSASVGMTLVSMAVFGAAAPVHANGSSFTQSSFAVQRVASLTGFDLAFASRSNCPIYYGCPAPPAPPTGGGGKKGGEPQLPKLVASDDHPECQMFDDRCPTNPEPPDRHDRDDRDNDREHHRGHDRG